MPDDNERRHHSLTREDLTVLLESYKNMIESNLQVMDKQLTAINKINELCKVFSALNTFLDGNFRDIHEALKGVNNHHMECAKHQLDYNTSLKDILKNDHTENQTTHLKQGFKLYGLIGMFGTIILGLIGLIYKLWPSNHLPPH